MLADHIFVGSNPARCTCLKVDIKHLLLLLLWRNWLAHSTVINMLIKDRVIERLRVQASPEAKFDTVSEWLKRWTWNPLGSTRAGSNPVGVVVVESDVKWHHYVMLLWRNWLAHSTVINALKRLSHRKVESSSLSRSLYNTCNLIVKSWSFQPVMVVQIHPGIMS